MFVILALALGSGDVVLDGPRAGPRNGELNLYWGELHLHTAESFDSTMMGNKLGVEDAYRFAKGEPLTGAGGETMQLSRPLDFVAITDHAESFGIRTHCNDPNLSMLDRAACWVMAQDNPIFLGIIVEGARGTADPASFDRGTGAVPFLSQETGLNISPFGCAGHGRSAVASKYIAGMILLGVALCRAMVFFWSQLTKGDPYNWTDGAP